MELFITIFGFIVGTVLGSFSGAWADRYLREKSMWGRSQCVSCKKKLSWFNLVPIFSFVLQSGKCSFCKNKIPREDFGVEIVLGLLSGLIFYLTFKDPLSLYSPVIFYKLIFELFVLTVLSTITIIDYKVYLIPDKIIFPSILISIFYWIVGIIFFNFSPEIFSQALISAASASLFFAFLIIATRGKGMGWGDVKYVFFLGLILGFPNILVGIFLSFLLGAVVSLVLISIRKKSFGAVVPFGPFLSLGTLIAIYFGDDLFQLYLGLVRY